MMDPRYNILINSSASAVATRLTTNYATIPLPKVGPSISLTTTPPTNHPFPLSPSPSILQSHHPTHNAI